jgi:hypothetical protein
MPNSLGPLGLTTATQAELLANLTASMQALYGSDINLSSDTPDGQLINIFNQSQLDVQDLLTQVYNSFDPDNAIGVVLDQRVAINGIQRQGGTFTVTNITLVTSQSVNLYGLDQTVQPVYTLSDNAGNLWELMTTQLGVSVGTNVFAFQAANPGAIVSLPNTITIQVTIELGVTSVNNPTTYTTLGVNAESDANLKLRRQRSVSIVSQGYLAGLLATLQNIPGVTSAFVYENDTDTTDADGVPGHSIWVIVAGSATASAIATAIYQKRNAGCGMFGQTSYTLTQVNGTLFTVYWDDVQPQNLFIEFTATSINGSAQPMIAAILAGLPTSFVPGVFQEVNINALATAIQAIDPNTLVTNAGFSVAQTQIATLSGVAASGTFEINYNGNTSAAINWNDSISTIQTKVQAVTGLSSALVTGSIASQTLTFNLTAIADVQGLLYVTSNSLMTSAPAAITFSFNERYSNTLTPSKKDEQFAVSVANIIILPMILSPTTSSVAPLANETFTGLGGYAPFTYSISINNSGGSINASSGVYTAGSTGSVTDTILVVDAFGNSATATVQVT